MPLVRHARRLVAAAAYGGGLGVAGLGTAGLVSYGILKMEAHLARRTVGRPFEAGPDDSTIYGSGLGRPLQLVLIGDSLAAGVGVVNRFHTIGGLLSVALSTLAGRSVRLTNTSVTGAESSMLDEQIDRALLETPRPDVSVVIVGGNDVTHRVPISAAVAHLARAVERLRDTGSSVVVATCPDLATVQPVQHPLRGLARRWSRDLAAAQTIAVVEAGGRTVALADLLAPDFLSHPDHFFSVDRFHPSAAGYARTASVLLPSVCAALGLWAGEVEVRPDRLRGESLGPVAAEASRAVRVAGTEVAPLPHEAQAEMRPGTAPPTRRALRLRRRRPEPLARPDTAPSTAGETL